ncbi:hypothetical protein EDD16DRAFT_1517367 [Pisolithus croceorrhizus]|nr:hypothetical protein EDD16DRAFT_1517367 [Pisolithus croceorrhizus]KAI6130052.1 hypothetical protein EV401DRAFT_1884499 [Pisolithus croceorrhizus]KAI6160466.1 hypothetical protein EDD17DRAFT_1761042 [Pisolithus thermaeus]
MYAHRAKSGQNKLPDGGNPPPDDNSCQAPKGPPEVQKNNKNTEESQLLAGSANKGKSTRQLRTGALDVHMPGGLNTSTMLGSSIKQAARESTEVIRDSMSPLTPQQTKLDNSWMSSDPVLVWRTQSPPIELYDEGETPLRRENIERDAPINPCMAFEAMNDFLESLQQQWLEYGYGPKGFNNHGVNPGAHHAEELERYRQALAAKSVSRTTTLDVKPMLKREDTIPQFWPGMLVRRENPPAERTDALGQWGGFAPNMLDCPAYFSR